MTLFPPKKNFWPWYLTLTNDLDFDTKRKVLPQGIYMWNMKSSITYHSKDMANVKVFGDKQWDKRTTLLKKIKGSDVLHYERKIIFPEQDYANLFLLVKFIQSYHCKLSQQAKEFDLHKRCMGSSSQSHFSKCHIGLSEDQRCHCLSCPPLSLDLTRIWTKDWKNYDKLFKKRTRKNNFLIFFLTWLISI